MTWRNSELRYRAVASGASPESHDDPSQQLRPERTNDPNGAPVNTASLDPANRPTVTRRIDFRPGMDMRWEILRNGEDTDGEVLEADSWLGPHPPSPPVHVHDNAEDSF